MLDVHFCHRLTITTKQEGSFLQQKINYTTKHLSNSVCAHAITVLVCGQGGRAGIVFLLLGGRLTLLHLKKTWLK